MKRTVFTTIFMISLFAAATAFAAGAGMSGSQGTTGGSPGMGSQESINGGSPGRGSQGTQDDVRPYYPESGTGTSDGGLREDRGVGESGTESLEPGDTLDRRGSEGGTLQPGGSTLNSPGVGEGGRTRPAP